VIVDDFDVRWTVSGPREADTITVVDPNAVLSSSLTHELLEPIAWRSSEIFQELGLIQVI
jgi:hypothetical protein